MSAVGWTLLGCVAAVAQREALPAEVARCIDAFVDPSSLWTLESASVAGSVYMLHRLAPNAVTAFRRLRQQRAIQKASEAGDLAVLQWWALSFPAKLSRSDYRSVFETAVQAGHLHVLKWLEQQGRLPRRDREIPLLINCSDPEVVYWLHGQGLQVWLHVSLLDAATRGDLAFISWVHQRQHLFRAVNDWSLLVYWAARANHLPIVQWVHENRSKDFSKRVLIGAIEGGHLAIARWAESKSVHSATLLDRPFQAVGVEMAVYLLTKFPWASSKDRRDWIKKALISAGRLGDLDVVQLLYQHRNKSDTSGMLMDKAAEYGHLHIVRWLDIQGAVCSANAMDGALLNGHLHVVQWLHDQRSEGCSPLIVRMAALYGQVESVQWLHQNQLARLDTEVMQHALQGGQLEVIQYIIVNTNASSWWTGREMQIAAEGGHLGIVKWFHERGIAGQLDVGLVAERGHLEVVQFVVVELNIPCSLTSPVLAEEFDNLAVLEWLMRRESTLMAL